MLTLDYNCYCHLVIFQRTNILVINVSIILDVSTLANSPRQDSIVSHKTILTIPNNTFPVDNIPG